MPSTASLLKAQTDTHVWCTEQKAPSAAHHPGETISTVGVPNMAMPRLRAEVSKLPCSSNPAAPENFGPTGIHNLWDGFVSCYTNMKLNDGIHRFHGGQLATWHVVTRLQQR